MSFWSELLITADRLLFGRAKSDLRWWERRARRRGVRSVYSLGHSRDELPAVTQMQEQILFPILQRHLRGDERVVLDFGCGPGRFTAKLARLLGGRAIGVDPIATLIDLAPPDPQVEYRVIRQGQIPIESASVDVIWSCLVLMTITDAAALERAVGELRRVLRPGGLLFLVENTQERADSAHLRYRSIQEYQQLLHWAHLQHVQDYEDLSERISVLVGRTE